MRKGIIDHGHVDNSPNAGVCVLNPIVVSLIRFRGSHAIGCEIRGTAPRLTEEVP